jgi:hypothetical protein
VFGFTKYLDLAEIFGDFCKSFVSRISFSFYITSIFFFLNAEYISNLFCGESIILLYLSESYLKGENDDFLTDFSI